MPCLPMTADCFEKLDIEDSNMSFKAELLETKKAKIAKDDSYECESLVHSEFIDFILA